MLGLERDRKWIVCLVSSHGRDVDAFRVGEIRLGSTVNVAQQLGYFSDSIGSVVEEKKCVVI